MEQVTYLTELAHEAPAMIAYAIGIVCCVVAFFGLACLASK